jgi:hypothetical protein
MNLHTFKDVVNAKKSSLVNDLDEGDEEKEVGVLRKPVEGEEDNGDDKVSIIMILRWRSSATVTLFEV